MEGRNGEMIYELKKIKNVGLIEQINSFIETYGEEKLMDILKDNSNFDAFYECNHRMNKNIIRINDILYLEIFVHEIYVHTKYGIFTKYGNLKEEEEKLKTHGFIRCSQSYLIAIKQIKSYDGKAVSLYTGETISVSKTYRSLFEGFIQK